MSLSRFQSASKICLKSTTTLPTGKSFHILFICQSQSSNAEIKENVKKQLQRDGLTCGDCVPGLSTFENIVQTIKSAVTVIPLITEEFMKSADCNNKLEIAKQLYINSGDKQQSFIIPLVDYLSTQNIPNTIMTVNCINMTEPIDIWYPRLKQGLKYALETYTNEWIPTFDLVSDLPLEEREKLGIALLNNKMRGLAPVKEIEIASDLMKDKTIDEKLLFCANLFESDVQQVEKLIRIINPVTYQSLSTQTENNNIICVDNNENTNTACTSRSWKDIFLSLTKSQKFVIIICSMLSMIGLMYVCFQLPDLFRLIFRILF